ncbi:SGNH/GDSL hydrolase family protein [Micromonospora sp. Llam7]|uniref:SGNH/GDSL hydrolase family protein n=1 Tax=Micromonospora tarapacensis TaxID=2835305 RepID=UPI001C836DFB|nr:SGNH/GDSL hydrolase family protein [Micromonospora tarapacensis]MBX7268800.1 SGNH/GDSL hydrolase family protein [Micromonospora tarapacensis]
MFIPIEEFLRGCEARMRQRSKLLATLFGALLAVPMLVLGPATPAQADPIPPTNYSPVTISDIPSARHMLTDTTNGVTVGCPNGSGTNAFKSFAADGTVTQTRVYANPYAEFCTWNTAVGRDGTIFTYASTNNGYVHLMQAWKDGSLVWEYTLPCGAYGIAHATRVGPDGNVYVLLSSGLCSGAKLVGLSAEPQSGTTSPNVVLNASFSGGSSLSGGGLAVHDGGFVVRWPDSVQYVSLTGVADTPISTPNANTLYGETDYWFDATTSGRVFVATAANSVSTTGCQWPGSAVGSITAIDPSGAAWTETFSQCSYIHELRPLPTGGVLVQMEYEPPESDAVVHKVIAFDVAGNQVWTTDFNNTDLDLMYSNMVTSVDLNGNVAVQHNATVIKQINGSTYKFPEIRFMLLSGGTGETIAGTGFTLRGDNTNTSGPSYRSDGLGTVFIADDTAYVAAKECTTLNYCDASTTKLYAFTVPGLEMDYPRGAILKHDEPWLSYVAMGDSFSSGQGASQYEAGTDTATNQCYRSSVAYSRQLNNLPGMRLDLKAFVACGGSETSHVMNGRFGEDPQIDAIDEYDPDVVTITIGGNNIGFAPLAKKCVESLDCTASTEYTYARDRLDNHLASELSTLYYNMGLRIGPQTRVLVVGYPEMIPDPAVNTLPNCLYLTYDEKVAARGVISDLNQVIQDEVAGAGVRFEYVNPGEADSPFKGHELCMDGSYFNGVVTPLDDSLHPNPQGQGAYRQVITEYLLENPYPIEES